MGTGGWSDGNGIRPRTAHRFLAIGATLLTGLAFAACSDTAPSSIAATTSTVAGVDDVQPDDGILTLGVLTPSSGDGAVIGRSVTEGVRLAVADINAAGGVDDARVQLVVGEEGQSSAETTASIAKLMDAGVDAVIGPTSSLVALSALGEILANDIVACSPTASAMALDGFPDNGLFFRTVPSDSLQAAAIAEEVERTGTDRAAVAYVDDAYGRPFGEAVRDALVRRGVAVSVDLPFRTDDESPTNVAQQINADAADTVVVLASADDGPLLLQALVDGEGDRAPTYIVNGAQEGSASSIVSAADVLGRIRGVAPAATGASGDFDRRLRLSAPDSPGFYALNAYDCATLIALAAQAGAGQRSAIAPGMVEASTGGSNCTTYAQCAAVIATGRNVDYDGPGGSLSLRTNGDVATAQFVVFGYDAAGRSDELARFTVSS